MSLSSITLYFCMLNGAIDHRQIYQVWLSSDSYLCRSFRYFLLLNKSGKINCKFSCGACPLQYGVQFGDNVFGVQCIETVDGCDCMLIAHYEGNNVPDIGILITPVQCKSLNIFFIPLTLFLWNKWICKI